MREAKIEHGAQILPQTWKTNWQPILDFIAIVQGQNPACANVFRLLTQFTDCDRESCRTCRSSPIQLTSPASGRCSSAPNKKRGGHEPTRPRYLRAMHLRTADDRPVVWPLVEAWQADTLALPKNNGGGLGAEHLTCTGRTRRGAVWPHSARVAAAGEQVRRDARPRLASRLQLPGWILDPLSSRGCSRAQHPGGDGPLSGGPCVVLTDDHAGDHQPRFRHDRRDSTASGDHRWWRCRAGSLTASCSGALLRMSRISGSAHPPSHED